MPISIKNSEADKLARELARRTGETITQAVTVALRERLMREKARSAAQHMVDDLMEIGRLCAALPVVDPRSPDEIIDYNEQGAPR